MSEQVDAEVNPAPPTSTSDDSVAVVIPCYNGAKYLAEAIESALQQTLPARDVIVVDDGSTDDSLLVAARYPSVRVVSQRNAGVSASRNRVLDLSSSKWVAFLDADDIWEKDKLERQVDTLRKTDADVCIVGLRTLDQTRDPENRVVAEFIHVLPPPEEIGPSLYRHLRFPPSSVMIRRDTFASAGGFDRFAQPCEDWDLWLRLEQAKARFVTCPEPLLVYRIHTSNTSSRDAYRMYHAEMRAYDRLVAKRFHPALRSTHRLYFQSKFLLGVAVVERQQGRPHLNALMGSIAIFPFGRWMRYKIAAHVLLKRARLVG